MDKRETKVRSKLTFQRKTARLFLFAERVWYSSAALFCIIGAFAALTLAGIWQQLDPILHLSALVAFAISFLFAVRQFLDRFKLPQKPEADARLEQESNLQHRPLRSMDAAPFAPDMQNEQARAFWQMHQDQQQEALKRVNSFLPRFGLSLGDTYSLRALIILLLLSGYVTGGAAPFSHFRTAFIPSLGGPIEQVELDIWAVPPDYTAIAPQLIHQLPSNLNAQTENADAGDTIIPLFRLPIGTKLIGRVSGGNDQIPMLLNGEEQFVFQSIESQNYQIEHTDLGSGRWTLQKGSEVLAQWDVDIIPDLAPIVRILTLPNVTDRSALNLVVMAEDDYGITELKGYISKIDQSEVFEIILPFPTGATYTESKSYHDLTAHPWAGFVVDLWAAGKDITEQEGQSKKVRITLPERNFSNPIARALVHERKQLFSDPDGNRFDVVGALDVIISLPEAITNDLGAILMVSVARSTLLFQSGEKPIAEAAELLWQAALKFENGNLTLAEEALREAEKRLMEALNNGASDEEIKQLVEELKQAMNEFLQELARNQGNIEQNPNGSETLQSQDLNDFLDQIDEFARSGAREEARNLLSQLQDILENLQAAGAQQGQSAQIDQKMLDNLEKLMEQQQQLLDQTMRSSRPNGYLQDPSVGSNSEEFGKLAEQQEALRQMLGEMMGDMGLKGKIPGALGKAERAMNAARESLQMGEGGTAQEAQQQALQQLQRGLEGMAQAQGMGAAGQIGKNGNTDPLGRSTGDRANRPDPNSGINIFGKSNLSTTREVLNELRRRLSDPSRPELEKKYLKRLMERF